MVEYLCQLVHADPEKTAGDSIQACCYLQIYTLGPITQMSMTLVTSIPEAVGTCSQNFWSVYSPHIFSTLQPPLPKASLHNVPESHPRVAGCSVSTPFRYSLCLVLALHWSLCFLMFSASSCLLPTFPKSHCCLLPLALCAHSYLVSQGFGTCFLQPFPLRAF